jgi:hypothetical protein
MLADLRLRPKLVNCISAWRFGKSNPVALAIASAAASANNKTSAAM